MNIEELIAELAEIAPDVSVSYGQLFSRYGGWMREVEGYSEIALSAEGVRDRNYNDDNKSKAFNRPAIIKGAKAMQEKAAEYLSAQETREAVNKHILRDYKAAEVEFKAATGRGDVIGYMEGEDFYITLDAAGKVVIKTDGAQPEQIAKILSILQENES